MASLIGDEWLPTVWLKDDHRDSELSSADRAAITTVPVLENMYNFELRLHSSHEGAEFWGRKVCRYSANRS